MDLDLICRLCASKKGLKIDLFDMRLGFIDKITKFIPLKISENDKLPSKICFRCAMLISDFEEFYLNCLRIQDTFLESNHDGEESLSEGHMNSGPKSKRSTLQFSRISDDPAEDSDGSEMDESHCESDDSQGSVPAGSTECDANEEPQSRSFKKSKSHSNRKYSKKNSDNHSKSDNGDTPMPPSLLDENNVPSHIKKTIVPLPGSSQAIFTCGYCTQIFTSKTMAYSHVCSNLLNNCKREEIIERSNTYTCELCYQVFSRQAVLQAHRVGHMNDSSGEGSGDEIYDENVCVFGQKRKKKRRGNRVPRDGIGYKLFFENEEN